MGEEVGDFIAQDRADMVDIGHVVVVRVEVLCEEPR